MNLPYKVSQDAWTVFKQYIAPPLAHLIEHLQNDAIRVAYQTYAYSSFQLFI